MLAVQSPSVYEVGGPSTAVAEGPSFPLPAPGLPVPPSMIEDLSTRLGNLEYEHGQLVKKGIQVSDAEVATGVIVGEIGPKVFAIEGQETNSGSGLKLKGSKQSHIKVHFKGIIAKVQCQRFKYQRNTKNEAVRLMMFPLPITGEAKTWLDELNKGTIEMWDELRTAFISRFFPPALFDRLLREIRAFSQHENESLADAWLRMKEMLRNCHGHNLSKGNIIKIFYHEFNKITQEVLNAAAGGIFLCKTPNQAYQLLEDKVLLKLD
ncbi:reverse transcriptase domain-containing protein [Tanacetum coccineum]